MRGSYEVNNEKFPFQVQYIGLDDLCIRNLATDEIVHREKKVLGGGSKTQWDNLDAQCLKLARERRTNALATPALATGGETLAETAARLGVPH